MILRWIEDLFVLEHDTHFRYPYLAGSDFVTTVTTTILSTNNKSLKSSLQIPFHLLHTKIISAS